MDFSSNATSNVCVCEHDVCSACGRIQILYSEPKPFYEDEDIEEHMSASGDFYVYFGDGEDDDEEEDDEERDEEDDWEDCENGEEDEDNDEYEGVYDSDGDHAWSEVAEELNRVEDIQRDDDTNGTNKSLNSANIPNSPNLPTTPANFSSSTTPNPSTSIVDLKASAKDNTHEISGS